MEFNPDHISSLWHKRLKHVIERGLHELEKQGLLKGEKQGNFHFVKTLCLERQSGYSLKSQFILQLGFAITFILIFGAFLSINTCGGMYILTMIDDYSRKIWVYIMKSKDATFEKFKEWKTLVEVQIGRRVKKLKD